MADEPATGKDSRTRVDRILDRIKNNRIAALIIVAAIGLGGLAGLTDSLTRLSRLLPSLSSPDVSGEWHSTASAFYPIGPEIMVLRLQESVDGQVVGNLEFRTLQGEARSRRFDVLDGKRVGKKLSFAFSSGAVLYTPKESITLKESVTGELVGQELRLLYVRQGHTGVPVTARRVEESRD